jgi:hypothetical protein
MQFQFPEWQMVDSKRKNVPTIVKMGPFGRDKVYDLINKGHVESKLVDGRRLVNTPSYQRYLDQGGSK